MQITKTKKSKISVSAKQVGVFKAGTFGETLDYDVFNPLTYNRGKKDSIDPKVVKKHFNDMKDGNYFDTGWDALVNIFGDLLDGNSRSQAKMKLGLPIRYYVTTTDALNVRNHKKIIGKISYLNSHNPQWEKRDTFEAALMWKYNLALRIDELRDEISIRTGLKTNQVKVSWIYALVKKSAFLFKNSKELDLVTSYNDSEAVTYSHTNEFTIDLDRFVELVMLVKHQEVRFINIVQPIFKLHWEQRLFDMDRLLNKINSYGLDLTGKLVGHAKVAIQTTYNTAKGRVGEYFQLYKDIVPHKNSSIVHNSFTFKY